MRARRLLVVRCRVSATVSSTSSSTTTPHTGTHDTGLLALQTGIVTKTDDYGELAYRACGKKGEFCVDIWTVAEGIGGCLGYLVIIGLNMSSVLRYWVGTDEDTW